MKILLFGKNGQVGWELQRTLSTLGDVIATDSRMHEPYLCGDLQDLNGLRSTILQQRPRVIVNAAAYTNVNLAESEMPLADRINHLAPAAIAQAAKEIGALLVHYSTDYVFAGTGDYARSESAAVGPVNAYGESKLKGEIAVRASGCQHLIFRTSWVYAARGNNFLKTMLRMAQERHELQVVADEFGTPTSAELVADASSAALHIALRKPSLCGLYHLCAAGHTNWHEYASFIVETARRYGAHLRVANPQAIHAISSSDLQAQARRPRNSRLDASKLMNTFQLKMPDWHFGVERTVRELVEHPHHLNQIVL